MVYLSSLQTNIKMISGAKEKIIHNMPCVLRQSVKVWRFEEPKTNFTKIMSVKHCTSSLHNINYRRTLEMKLHCRSSRETQRMITNIAITNKNILPFHLYKCLELMKNLKKIQIRQASNCAQSLKLTNEELKRPETTNKSKKCSFPTHNCGELNMEHNGLKVTLCAWVVAKQGRLVQLQDGYGHVQAVLTTLHNDLHSVIKRCEPGTLVEVTGVVNFESNSQINEKKQEIEVQIASFKPIFTIPKSGIQRDDDTNVNSFTMRSYNCGQLREEHIGEEVTLCGWLEFHRVGKFIILRDGYGRTQLIIPEESKQLQEEVDKLPLESILKVDGVVQPRPAGNVQSAMDTGRVEVVLQRLSVLNRARATLPFNLREFNKAKEPLRMQYRYLDLRFADMQHNLRMRSRLLMDMRDFLVNYAGFVDVETPTLFRPTPGGAQEFVVPTRTPGHFYSLVQSPQQFKQMLMAGAIDRYFQIARCYRDEGGRSDKQPEFTQLDIEMSFTSVNGVIDLVERLLEHSWPRNMEPLTIPFKRMSYQQAEELYGSDKPDLSIPFQLIDCTEILRTMENLISQSLDFDARALVFRKPFTDFTNAMKLKYSSHLASAHPKAKLIQHKFTSHVDNWIKSVSRLLGDSIPKILGEKLNLGDDCVLFLAYGSKKDVCTLLGKVRLDFTNHLEEKGYEVRDHTQKMNFTWIVDFPLFEENEDGVLVSAHHPFTAPHPDDAPLLDSDPLKVRSQSYDLVLNGNEVAGGSIRIHNPEQQRYILDKLQIRSDTMQHLLDALASGCPPHGGVALGLDRLLAVILNTNSIRDVIAFPKSLEGRDSLSGAPVPISDHDKKLYHLR